jgi:hypothetical protein
VTLFNGPAYIATPAPPQAPPGLFDVAMGPMPFPRPEAQGGGVIYVPDTCSGPINLRALNCPAVTGAKTFTGIETAVSGAPFAVYSSYTCGSIGFSFDEVRQRVVTRLQLQEQRAVEKRLWQGDTTQGITGLFRNAANLGSASCATEAIQILEQALADNAIVGGLIHARPGMVAHLAVAMQLDRGVNNKTSRVWMTPLGTPYAFGQGYDGSGPTGQAATASNEWMYATGRVLVWQDPEIFVPPIGQTMDKTTNQITTIAERVYAVAVECYVGAVQVPRGCVSALG